MFPAAYFGPRYFAARYWAKLGGVAVPFNPAWAINSNRAVGF